MKKYIYLLLTIVLAGSFGSCKDALELPADGRISYESIFSDRNRTMGYLNQCYAYRMGYGIDQAAAYTDDAQSVNDVSSYSAATKWYAGQVGASNWIFPSWWSNYYQGIRYCNVFIKTIPTATAFALPAERAGWAAQAKALRALYYLGLIKDYGPVPLITEAYDFDHNFAADKRSKVWEIVKQILQDTDEALAADGAEDMTYEAKGFRWILGDNYANMMHRAVAYAIRSQAILLAVSPLYAQEEGNPYTWEDAAKITKEALDQCLAHDYQLFTELPLIKSDAHDAYAFYFLTPYSYSRTTDKETIYSLGGYINAWKEYGLPTNKQQISAGFSPSQELIDCYETKDGWPVIDGYADANHLRPNIVAQSGYNDQYPYEDRDPRFYSSIYYNGATRHLDKPDEKVKIYDNAMPKDSSCAISATLVQYTRTGYYLRKYNRHTSSFEKPNEGQLRAFRLAELYLNFAEAANRASYGPTGKVPGVSGQPDMSALEAVNIIRDRAGMPEVQSVYTTDAETFEKRIRNERRVEFAFETLRFYDIRRWKALGDGAVVTGMRATKDENSGRFTYKRFVVSERKSTDDKYLLYPLPMGEVNKMYKHTGVNWQNPGYESPE